jgi:hypothetical protein
MASMASFEALSPRKRLMVIFCGYSALKNNGKIKKNINESGIKTSFAANCINLCV